MGGGEREKDQEEEGEKVTSAVCLEVIVGWIAGEYSGTGNDFG